MAAPAEPGPDPAIAADPPRPPPVADAAPPAATVAPRAAPRPEPRPGRGTLPGQAPPAAARAEPPAAPRSAAQAGAEARARTGEQPRAQSGAQPGGRAGERAGERAAGAGGGITAGRAGQSEAADEGARASWAASVRTRIERAKAFPPEAAGAAGRVTIALRIGADGALRSVSVAAGSGHAALDAAAIAAVRRAAPFPPAPAGVPGGDFRLTIRFDR
jgi:protein TonB